MAVRKTFVILLLVALQLYSVVSQGDTTDTTFETSITTPGNPTVTDGTAGETETDPSTANGTTLGFGTNPSVTDGTALETETDPSTANGTTLGFETHPPVTALTPITNPTITVTTNICPYPDSINLFNNGGCVSRTTYTGIFLSSIILAGISFLMLAGLLILLCTKRIGHSGSAHSDDESNNWSGKNNTSASPYGPHRIENRVKNQTPTIQPKPVGQKQPESHRVPSKPPVNNSHVRSHATDDQIAHKARANRRKLPKDVKNNTSF
ncbi:unnamed protein product [Rotaria magnacalcarata]|uniref:Uncharacterized protein n=1 Tax=Rotaria magnacalcarata TaxID=392030 RepID=A0A815GBZ1_9BILA|nr:unnamed protein product [Rotaria magnacalcarata]CAF1633988.1 unnamed protein product [Rotaria magnacalcarata]